MTSEPEPQLSLKEIPTTTSSTSSLMTDLSKRNTVYFHGGIGGAGNYRKIPRLEDSEPTTSTPRPRQPRRLHLPRWHQNIFSSGIGGAGNMHTRGEEAALTEAEEEAKARARDIQPPRLRWFVGIGGVGNRRTRRQESPSSGYSGTTGGAYSAEALPYGAADIMRRKMFGERAVGK